MFYLITISAATLIIAIGNFLVDGVYSLAAFGLLLLCTVAGVAAVIAVDGLFAFAIRRLPEKWFAPEAPAFSVGKRERNLYRKARLNSWKKYVPEWGCFTGFHKDKVRDPSSSAYIGRFLIESNYGVAGHVIGALAGFAVMLLPFLRPFAVAFPLACINFILGILPTMILRSNTPSLRALYQKNLKRESKQGAMKV